MIQEINNEESIAQIQKNQTQKLIEMFQELFSDKKEELKILRRVNLMTPENIHLIHSCTNQFWICLMNI